MPKRNAKGHFVKAHRARNPRKRRSKSRAMARYSPAVVTRYRTKSAPRRHRRHHRGGGGMNITHLAIAGAGLAYLAGADSPIKAIPENVAKIPGAKTFGNPATLGLVCLGVDRFVKKNKWLRAAGVIGVVLGAVQVGTQGSNFKWLGDADGGAGGSDGYIGDMDDE